MRSRGTDAGADGAGRPVTGASVRLRVPVTGSVALSAFPRGLEELRGTPFLLVHGLASNARTVGRRGRGARATGSPERRHRPARARPGQQAGRRLRLRDARQRPAPRSSTRWTSSRPSWPASPGAATWSWSLPPVIPAGSGASSAVDGGTIELSARAARNGSRPRRSSAPPDLRGTPVTELEAWIRRAHPDWPESGIAGTLANFQVLADGTVAPWLTRERHMTILRELWEHHPARLYPTIRVPVLLPERGARGRGPGTDRRSRRASRRGGAAGHPARQRGVVPPADHDLHAQFPERLRPIAGRLRGDPSPAPAVTTPDARHGSWPSWDRARRHRPWPRCIASCSRGSARRRSRPCCWTRPTASRRTPTRSPPGRSTTSGTTSGYPMTLAPFRGGEPDPLERATAVARAREAQYLFAGPGSPSYALRAVAGHGGALDRGGQAGAGRHRRRSPVPRP